MIPTELIERTLALTGKNEWDVCELTMVDKSDDKIITKWKFSIEKFFYYILSPSFIEKYYESQRPWYMPDQATLDLMSWEFGYAIYAYQSGDSSKLINLLSKQ